MSESKMSIGDFFEQAYWLQRGQYFPEKHFQNIDELCQAFSWERDVIEALYRILPHFDYVAEEAAEKVKQGVLSPDRAYEDLSLPIFHFIPESVKESAWDLHLSNRGITRLSDGPNNSW